jgi:hypothetical protein
MKYQRLLTVGSSSHPLESAPDGESEEMILKPTTLAWNFTLLDPIDQAEMLAEIADLFQRPECLDMFYYFADRKGLLFLEEERVICKVETGPALYSDIASRVCGCDVSATKALSLRSGEVSAPHLRRTKSISCFDYLKVVRS